AAGRGRSLVGEVRAAKEMLSRATTASVPVPLLELEARVTRVEFEELARPFLGRTVRTTTDAIAAAGLPPERVAAVLLVGGSSRIPLVADLRRAGTRPVPSTMDQPGRVVAEGSLRLATGGSGRTRAGRRALPSGGRNRPGDAVPVAPEPVVPEPRTQGFGDAVDPWLAKSPTVETPRPE